MTVRPQVRRFARRIRSAVAARALFDALGVTALALVGGVLVARIFGLHVPPRTWWLVGLIVPLAWAAWRAHRETPAGTRAAVEIDHRLGLRGLLITEAERDTGAWNEHLDRDLDRAFRELPRIQWAGMATRGLIPVAVLLGTCFLPPPEVTPSLTNALIERDLTELEQEVQQLQEEAAISELRGEELEARLDQMRQRFLDGESVTWSDTDDLRADLALERTMLRDALDEARAEVAEILASANANDAASTADQLSELLSQATDSGALAELDPELLSQLQQAGESANASGSGSSLTGEELAALAKALQSALDERAMQLADAGLVDPSELADLAALVRAAQKEREPTHQHGPG